MHFTVGNQETFQASSAIHSINTKNKYNLCRSTANILRFQKST